MPNRLVGVLLALGLPGSALAGVVLNELLPDPSGVDAGAEWVELLNTGPFAVDITGWELEAGTSSFSSKHTFAALVLQPGDRLWVGEVGVIGVDVVTGTLAMGNAGGSGDAVRLVDSFGVAMDTVVYGPNNTDAWLDDTGAVATSIAAMSGGGESLARLPDGTDTDQSGADFSIAAPPTPDASNDVAPPPDTTDTGPFAPACDLLGIAINEIEADPAGADTDLEWVELYNPGGSDLDLSGWAIESGTSSFSSSGVIPPGTVIPAGGFLVVGQTAIAAVDVLAPGFDLGNASGSADGVHLIACDGAVVDTVIYGAPNSDGWLDDSLAVATSLAPDADEPSTIGRLADGIDTNLSGDDFAILGTPTPRASNAPLPDTGIPPGGCDLTGVVLNEIEGDPVGADANLEWVELYNPTASDVDVSGWMIESGTSSFSNSGTLPAATVVPAGGFLVVGQTAIPAADVIAPGFDLGNASGSADGVHLLACDGSTVDTVIYGTPNTDGWVDDTLAVAVSLAPDAGEADTLGRVADGVDSQLSAVDFAASVPTPGATNGGGGGTPGACDDAVAGSAVVLNEFITNPAGTDTDLEWVELHNPGATSVDVSSWVIAAGSSSFSGTGTLPQGTVIPPGGFLVVGQTAIADADVVAPGFSLGNGSNADAVRLEDCNGEVVDTVVYGTPNSDGWIDDTLAVATSLAEVPGEDETLARVLDGADTDACAVDFAVAAFPSPGVSNNAPVEDCGATDSGVKINEFLYDPDGADEGLEWIELYHAGSTPVDLSDWAVQTATSSYSSAFTFPVGTVIQPGELLLVGDSAVAGTDFLASLGMGNASSSGDGIRIVDCAGFPADTVVYGENNTDGLIDDSLAAATSLAPQVGGGSSLQRVEDGYDTDQSAVDFAEQEIPTPGASNPLIAPVICVPSDGTVVLNEFVPNPASSDTSAEWVEIYNNGTTDADLSGWGIDVATSSWGDPDAVLPGGTILAAGGYLVIGGALSPATLTAEFSIGNATSNADGIRLLDCTGAQVDTVIYGEANPDGLLDDAGSVVPSAVPGEAGSLARDPDGFDSDLPADWVIRGAPSPGASNFFDPGVLGDEEPGGCGCGGGSAAGAPAPGSGCTTDPLRADALAIAAGLLLVLRRRR